MKSLINYILGETRGRTNGSSVRGIGRSIEKLIFINVLRDGDVVVDVGANCGRFTVLFSHLVGVRGGSTRSSRCRRLFRVYSDALPDSAGLTTYSSTPSAFLTAPVPVRSTCLATTGVRLRSRPTPGRRGPVNQMSDNTNAMSPPSTSISIDISIRAGFREGRHRRRELPHGLRGPAGPLSVGTHCCTGNLSRMVPRLWIPTHRHHGLPLVKLGIQISSWWTGGIHRVIDCTCELSIETFKGFRLTFCARIAQIGVCRG